MEEIKDTATKSRSPEDVQMQLNSIRHKAVKPFSIACGIITLIVYGFVAYASFIKEKNGEWLNAIVRFMGLPESLRNAVDRLGFGLLAILFLYCIVKIIALYNTQFRSTAVDGVRADDEQFTYLRDANIEYCKLLGIKNIPDVYITNRMDDMYFLGVKVNNPKIVKISMYYGSEPETAKFCLARELAKIYYKESGIGYFLSTFPGMLLQFFSRAYSRAKEYSYDRAAAVISQPEDVVNIMTSIIVNYQIKRQIDVEAYQNHIKDSSSSKSKETKAWTVANILSDIPVGQYRIRAISNPLMEDGKLF